MCIFKCSAGAPPQTPLGELIALQDPLAGFKGPTSNRREGKEGNGWGREGPNNNKGREVNGGRGGEEREGEGREQDGRGGEGKWRGLFKRGWR